jgi:hypothetical protein
MTGARYPRRFVSRVRLAVPALLTVIMVGCGSDQERRDVIDRHESITVPKPLPPDFEALELSAPPGQPSSDSTPSGTFWSRTNGGELEWYAEALHLSPGRAYRLEVVVDDSAVFTIASVRTDPTGELGGYGALSSFRDVVCTGAGASSPFPVAQARSFFVRIKDDGSAVRGTLGGGLTSPGAGLPCTGNGDGRWDYRLLSRVALLKK